MSGKWREVRTQTELDACVKAGDYAEIRGAGEFVAYGSSTVTAYGSSTVTAYGSSTVRAYDSSTVRAYGSSTVTASPHVPVHKLSPRSKIGGGIVIEVPDLTVVENWLTYYGVEVKRGYAVLFKGVNDAWKSGYGTAYQPGTKPTAPDFKPTNECGGGLHFSPRAFMTRAYCTPTRFVAVKVKVSDLVVIGLPHEADKVKAPSCTVLYECDEDGVEITPVEAVAS